MVHAVPDIEEVEWNQIPRTSVLYGLSLKNWWAQVTDANPCLRLELLDEGSFIPHRQLEKLRYYRRRAAKCGEVDFERATGDNCSEFLNELFQLHRDRWRTKNGEGVLSDPAVRDFHLAAAQKAASAGALRLYRMKLNRQVITVLYAFAGGKSTYYYLSGFDPAFDKLSPGTLIVGHAIEEAIAEGHRWFDFMRGQENYKYAWGALENRTKRVIGVKK
jgi:CelD/BcsL family acetyltransferase involved in cellulose biosynthesis